MNSTLFDKILREAEEDEKLNSYALFLKYCGRNGETKGKVAPMAITVLNQDDIFEYVQLKENSFVLLVHMEDRNKPVKIAIGREADCEKLPSDTDAKIYFDLDSMSEEVGESFGVPYVSQYHCMLELHPDGKVILQDLNSTNGTYHCEKGGHYEVGRFTPDSIFRDTYLFANEGGALFLQIKDCDMYDAAMMSLQIKRDKK